VYHVNETRNSFGLLTMFKADIHIQATYRSVAVSQRMPEGAPVTAALRPLFFSHAKLMNKGTMTADEYQLYLEAENERHCRGIDAR
jgi:hypothetical protein